MDLEPPAQLIYDGDVPNNPCLGDSIFFWHSGLPRSGFVSYISNFPYGSAAVDYLSGTFNVCDLTAETDSDILHFAREFKRHDRRLTVSPVRGNVVFARALLTEKIIWALSSK